jgi:capsular exopolysaccharide synthesis family protein
MSSTPATPAFNWNEVYHFFIENALLLLGSLAVTIVAALIYIFTATPLYDAIATVEVVQRQHKVVNTPGDEPDDYRSNDILETIEGNLGRLSLLVRVLQQPEAKADPFLATLAADPESAQNEGRLKGLEASIKVKLRRATRLVDVTVEHRDPATAQLVANLLVRSYIEEGYQNASGDYQNTSQFLTGEAQRMQDKLQGTETELQDYAQLVDLRQRILDERRQLDLLNQRYLEKHPKVIEAHALLADLQRQFLDEMSRRKIPGAVDSTTGMTDDQKVEREMVAEESRYNVLMQEETTEKTMYESVLDRLKEAGISQGFQDANVRVSEAAALPYRPAKPQALLILAIAVVLGGAIGTTLAWLRHSMNSSFRTVDEAEGKLHLPAFGAVPEIATRRGSVKKVPEKFWKKAPQFEAPPIGLIMENDRSSIAAEAIRTLRASLKLLGRHEQRKTFLFTSAVPSEGKSFITSNLAVALAQEGNRVLLIDGDLRKPMVHQIFHYERKQPGLAERLVESKTLAETVIATSIPNLSLMLAGGHSPNPAEILSDGGFQRVLREVTDLYDYIIVDSAPVHAVSDTLLIAEYLQTTTLVIRAGKTPGEACLRAVRLLRGAKAKVDGFVLNRLPRRTGFGYNPYYYYYQSSEKYGEAYGVAGKA